MDDRPQPNLEKSCRPLTFCQLRFVFLMDPGREPIAANTQPIGDSRVQKPVVKRPTVRNSASRVCLSILSQHSHRHFAQRTSLSHSHGKSLCALQWGRRQDNREKKMAEKGAKQVSNIFSLQATHGIMDVSGSTISRCFNL